MTLVVFAAKRHLTFVVRENVLFWQDTAGGLAVSHRGQKLGYGALLGLGVNALGRIIGNAEGLTYARSTKAGALLFQRLGGYPLFDGLGAIRCMHHRCDVQLLGLRPEGVSPSTGRIAESIKAKLLTQAVIAAN